MIDKIFHGDCIEGMKDIPTNSVDMIFSDLPYGMTDCEWDKALPFDQLWAQYERVAKDNAAIVLFSAQPFTTRLISSNMKHFRYCWYWKKNNKTGAPFAKVQPMRCIEDICVFYKHKPTYNPQGLKRLEKPIISKPEAHKASIYAEWRGKGEAIQRFTNYPVHLLEFKNVCTSGKERLHPTQKPVKLCEYLIKTYTNAGDIVLDSCAGSGSILRAAKNIDRRYIGFETDKKYFDAACERLAA